MTKQMRDVYAFNSLKALGVAASLLLGCSAPVDGASASDPTPSANAPAEVAASAEASETASLNADNDVAAADPLASLSAETRASLSPQTLAAPGSELQQSLGAIDPRCAYFYKNANYGVYLGSLCAYVNGNHLVSYSQWNDQISSIVVGGKINLHVCTEKDCRVGGSSPTGGPNEFARKWFYGQEKVPNLANLYAILEPSKWEFSYNDRLSYLQVVAK